MSNVVVKVENISKLYRLGEVGTGSLQQDMKRWWAKTRGKEDPFAKIGDVNDRTVKSDSQYVWSLKDINFEIESGDTLGIIGRNGAGKSTLLKILSRVTTATSGSIKVKGRIASLLEVGTGFHPDLTGRENIFLNGAILGMTKTEIKRKFDDIVDFSGVERYIDTPVKRYSSGMYIRLAFAVAAHLESEILIVDEVLAVGDAEFQKKCIGKMNSVSKNEGRTIIFVSHSTHAIKALCRKGVYLVNGQMRFAGEIEETLKVYEDDIKDPETERLISSYEATERPDSPAQILNVRLTDERGTEQTSFDVFDLIFVEYIFVIREAGLSPISPIINITKDDTELFWSFASDNQPAMIDKPWEPGIHRYRVQLPTPLKKGRYSIACKLGKLRITDIDSLPVKLRFEVEELSFNSDYKSFAHYRPGIIPALLDWHKF
ncbi:MAG: ATP-binding cassette domain-containing protein [Chitinophagaceae bacterium]|nr:ATP-binding cassette domain-containing protein [Chitinophagaceae bacterium]